ncbi:thioredoxin family protein [Metabacillus halosaccharovorans]|uniref:Thioredoxin family protein n=1 Tax=Metabacillus halosaccharovorans TaxID=930124 RepID=A0ABT3DGK2_9BACI|nr:thioredoxin family protein [Metabacillus halosaccharovorans]MCV9886136.1 thioredoxin family protein [Metabacillus halosaccharovorans]
MNLLDWYNNGLTKEEYINGMNVNKSEMMGIYDKFSLNETHKSRLASLKDKDLKGIVLTEDWCGDAMLNNPIFLKIAEEIGMEVRFVLRDSNLELMDQYLTNGTSRAIPIFIFLNSDGEEIAVWGPRAAKMQKFVMEERSKLPSKEDPAFSEKQSAMYKKITSAYQETPSYWDVVAESIIEKLIG